LNEFKAYYNEQRVHQGIEGTTPLERAGEDRIEPAELENYWWQSHCRGLFELPIAA
jgi:hypothetical protein